jgi:hypothetical protein
MKSRRRIAFLKAQDCADFLVEQVDYSRDLRSAKWVSGAICTAAILCAHVRFGSLADMAKAFRMSASPSKADITEDRGHVR